MSTPGPSITYEGSVGVRPAMGGVVLEETAKQLGTPLELAELVQAWLTWHTGFITEGESGRVRITVEYLGDGPTPHPRESPGWSRGGVDLVGLAGVRVAMLSPIDHHEDAPGPDDPDVLPPAP